MVIPADNEQSRVGSDRYVRRTIPIAHDPSQRTFEDRRAPQSGPIQPGVGPRHRALDVEIPLREIQQSHAVGADITAREVPAAKQRQLQTVGAVFYVQHPGDLVEHRPREIGVTRKLPDPSRLAERAIIVEPRAAAQTGPAENLVILRIPQTVIVNRGAVAAANRPIFPQHRAVVRKHRGAHIMVIPADNVQRAASGQRQNPVQRSGDPTDRPSQYCVRIPHQHAAVHGQGAAGVHRQ